MSESYAPEERRAAEEVRALPEPRARDDFRARLRAEFVSGEIAARTIPERRTVLPFPVRAGAVLALAAAAAGVFFLLGREPRWDVAGTPAAGEVRIDGRSRAAADADAWRRDLVPGARVAWSGPDALRLVLPGRLALQLLPDAEVTLPEPPGGRARRAARLDVERGAIQVSTGPDFAGGRLVVRTGPADVEVVGTTFAVIRMPDFACVCVLEGTVQLHTIAGETMAVPAGQRRVVHADGKVDAFDEIAPPEVPVLEAFRDEAQALLRGSGPGTR